MISKDEKEKFFRWLEFESQMDRQFLSGISKDWSHHYLEPSGEDGEILFPGLFNTGTHLIPVETVIEKCIEFEQTDEELITRAVVGRMNGLNDNWLLMSVNAYLRHLRNLIVVFDEQFCGLVDSCPSVIGVFGLSRRERARWFGDPVYEGQLGPSLTLLENRKAGVTPRGDRHTGLS